MTEQATNQVAVNFYILPDADMHNRHFFVYRLVEKAFKQQLPTLILAADREQLNQLDRLFWSADPTSFIPHEIIAPEKKAKNLPLIVLSETATMRDVVNFKPQVVIDLSYNTEPLNFPKVMLIANQHNDILINARKKYQSYTQKSITPTVHKISHKMLALSE